MPKKKSVLEGKSKDVVSSKDDVLDEPEDHEDSFEEHKEEMELGEVNEDVYTEEGLDLMTEDDEISPKEEGFMREVNKASKSKKKDK